MSWFRRKRWGMLLLGIWLTAQGAVALLNLPIPYLRLLLAALATVAGICILLDR